MAIVIMIVIMMVIRLDCKRAREMKGGEQDDLNRTLYHWMPSMAGASKPANRRNSYPERMSGSSFSNAIKGELHQIEERDQN